MSATYNYEVVEHWGLGPQGRPMGGVVPGVAADSQGRVFGGSPSPRPPCWSMTATESISTLGEPIC